MSAECEGVGREFAVLCGKSLEGDGLAVVFFGLLHDVTVPEGEVLVLDDDVVRFDVEGEGILYVVIGYFSVGELIADIRTACYSADYLVELVGVHGLLKPVENRQLAQVQLIYHKTAHICVI